MEWLGRIILVPILISGGFSKPISHISEVSCSSSQFWHGQPRVGIRFHRLNKHLAHRTAMLQMLSTSPGCHLFWLTGYRLDVPMIPSLGLINLLEQLIELQIPDYFLDYALLTKNNTGHGSTASWGDRHGEVPTKGASVLMDSEALHDGMCKHSRKFSEPCPFVLFMGVYGGFIT